MKWMIICWERDTEHSYIARHPLSCWQQKAMMGSHYSSSFSFFLRTTVFLLFSISNVFSTFASLTPDLCHPDQRDILLELKTEFKIQKPDGYSITSYGYSITSYPKTESWGTRSTDCCNWDGVTCNTESGKVIRLELSCSCLHGQLEPAWNISQVWTLLSTTSLFLRSQLSSVISCC